MSSADSLSPLVRSEGSASPPLKAGVEPPPPNSTCFVFTCRCTNLAVEGRITKDLEDKLANDRERKELGLERVWLGAHAERVKLAAYVTYDEEHAKSTVAAAGSSTTEPRTNGDTLGACWRKCWICGIGCYQVKGKRRGDAAVAGDWVLVDFKRDIAISSPHQSSSPAPPHAFSSLRLDRLPPSSFGRPPPVAPAAIYPPATSDELPPPHTHSSPSILPSIPDPFFLPPPFIPASPHLRDLCIQAVAHLHDEHARLEVQVREFVQQKSNEMKNLEEKVRSEVELLWKKWEAGPGRYEKQQLRRRSASLTRASEATRQKVSEFTHQPSGLQNLSSGSAELEEKAEEEAYFPPSLLAASLSANTFQAPPPRMNVPDTIEPLSHVRSNDKDLAASYMISHFEQAQEGRKPSKNQKATAHIEEDDEDIRGKDSWIGMERNEARKAMANGREGEPRLRERKGSKNGKRSVKFEEPQKQEKEDNSQDDHVFDFELDDQEPASTSTPISQVPLTAEANVPPSKLRNMVEHNLSTTFAADAPSHRAAWRRLEDKGGIYRTIQKKDSDSGSSRELDDEDTYGSGSGSKLAISVPVDIVFPKTRRAASGLEMERKTSLTDKRGILVPPLKQAMERSGGRGRTSSSTSLSGQRAGSASRERERDQVRTYSADPGAVFESLADGPVGDDDEEDDDDEGQGTLRDRFVPPHVLAGRQSAKTDVGWRSMAD
ncbi:hypothetical protein P7C73_g611, partial [Tremellales sp. Uapishka_1]